MPALHACVARHLRRHARSADNFELRVGLRRHGEANPGEDRRKIIFVRRGITQRVNIDLERIASAAEQKTPRGAKKGSAPRIVRYLLRGPRVLGEWWRPPTAGSNS